MLGHIIVHVVLRFLMMCNVNWVVVYPCIKFMRIQSNAGGHAIL
jgi:hypothetical protein